MLCRTLSPVLILRDSSVFGPVFFPFAPLGLRVLILSAIVFDFGSGPVFGGCPAESSPF